MPPAPEPEGEQQTAGDASRIAALGVLAASLAHELNQPLAAILTNAQAAQRFLAVESPDLEEVREILLDISENDRRAVEILHGLRALAQREPAEMVPLDLNQVVRAAADLADGAAHRRDVRLVLELEDDLPEIWGGAAQLRQALTNLVMNGLEAMEAGPGDRELLLRTRRVDGGSVEVAVRDTGTGIPEDQLSELFRAFHTTKSAGTGIGLWIARSFVQAHGGRLWAANNPERGATFFVTLPSTSEHQE